MKKIIVFICLSLMVNSILASDLLFNPSAKKVIIVGEGVTGTWAGAKISENLAQNDELIIVSPPKKDIIKDIGLRVISNYTTSAFTPIGIQIEMGPIVLEPPRQNDIKEALSSEQYMPELKLYISPNLDDETKKKFQRFITPNPNKDISSIILRYHREICLPEWKKYIADGGKGAEIIGPNILSADTQSLMKLRAKIIKNRVNSGYLAEDKELQILDPKKMAIALPRYAELIQTKQLSGLIGLNYDGRVINQAVMTTLHNRIQKGKPKVVRIHAWVDSLQIKKDDKGSMIVTGVKLRDGRALNSNVVVLAVGHGIEKLLQGTPLKLPILNKWGVVYSLPQSQQTGFKEQPTIIMRGLGIVSDMPGKPITFALGEWILPKGEEPDPKEVVNFVKKSILIFNKSFNIKELKKNPLPIYVQPRPMTLDGLPVLDSRTKGLIILNPSGSEGNTQAPGSAYFAASKVLEQLGRKVPSKLKLSDTIDWRQFELYTGRFDVQKTASLSLQNGLSAFKAPSRRRLGLSQ